MKPYGIKLTDVLGATYTRWFNTDGSYRSVRGISSELLQLGRQLDDVSLKQAIRNCSNMRNGICYEVLYEDDFKKI